MGQAPTLAKMQKDYGMENAIKWLVVELNEYADFAIMNEERKPELCQMQSLAGLIMARYSYLKLTEIMLFFFNLKCGDYGDTYGSIDPVRIMASLRRFMSDRWVIMEQAEREENKRRAEEDRKRAITRSEYEKMKGIKK